MNGLAQLILFYGGMFIFVCIIYCIVMLIFLGEIPSGSEQQLSIFY
ncbi:MAG: hypothetical protein FWH29_02460 [Methanobrevibacter sp.]|nr:hypothetical protein [Methanobrevibacter sp.]